MREVEKVAHTREPWHRYPYEYPNSHDVTEVATVGTDVIWSEAGPGDDDARRIVACVNACQGIPTEALEAGVASDLLEALEAAAPILQRFLSAGPATVQVDERQALRMAQAALRKARGEEVG